MRRSAQRAVRMRDVSIRVAVNRLHRTAHKDQRNAHEHEKKLPRALPVRSGTLKIHGIVTIAHDISNG